MPFSLANWASIRSIVKPAFLQARNVSTVCAMIFSSTLRERRNQNQIVETQTSSAAKINTDSFITLQSLPSLCRAICPQSKPATGVTADDSMLRIRRLKFTFAPKEEVPEPMVFLCVLEARLCFFHNNHLRY